MVIGVETFHVRTQCRLKECRYQQILADAEVNTYYVKSNSQYRAPTWPVLDVAAFKSCSPLNSTLDGISWFNSIMISALSEQESKRNV